MFTKIVTHVSPHLDEIFAIWLLRKFGRESFPGVENSVVEYPSGQLLVSEKDCDKQGSIFVGLGGGRFDEHKSTGRLKDSSASLLVAQYLGIRDLPGVKEILADVNYCDTHTGVHALQLSELVKVANRRLKIVNGQVLKWASQGLDAIFDSIVRPKETECRVNLNGIIRRFTKPEEGENEARFADQRAVQRLFTLVGVSEKLTFPTNFARIITAFQKSGRSEEDTVDWAMFVLNHCYGDQLDFQAMVEVADKNHQSWPAQAYTNSQGQFTIKISWLDSDNPLALKAMRFRDDRRDVVVIRNSKGQVAVFVDKGLGIPPINLVAMLRWLSLGDQEKGLFTWSQLQTEEDPTQRLRNRPSWYFQREASAIFNGSITHPEVLPTRLPKQMIVDAISQSLDVDLVRNWMKQRRIRFN